MNTILSFILAVLVIVLAQSRPLAADASVVVDRIVAVVNGEIITISDVEREASKPGAAADERLLLEDLINRKLQLSAAKRSGMDVSDQELSDALADIMKRNGMDQARFEAALLKEGLTLAQYRSDLKEQMTLSRVFNKFVRAGLSIDERDVRNYYDRNPQAFSLPEEIRVRQLLIKVPDSATESQVRTLREKAQNAFDRASRGEDFVVLVRTYSDGSAASQDGDLGFLTRGDVLPEIERAARPLKPGEIAGPVRSPLGFHVIRLEEIRSRQKPFDKVKDEITNQLYNQKLENTYRSWLQTLRNDSHIENRL